MASVNDWAAKCAHEIDEQFPQARSHSLQRPTEERIAAIIVLHAEPILKLLREAYNAQHSRGWNDESQDYPPCPLSYDDHNEDEKCTCGADAWNARVEKALNG